MLSFKFEDFIHVIGTKHRLQLCELKTDILPLNNCYYCDCFTYIVDKTFRGKFSY